MRYASVCSGVEAASLAWEPLGWQPVFFAEVEPFPCAVLQQRFNATKPLHPLDPAEAADEKDRKMRESWLKQINKLPDTGTIPNLGDFTKIKGDDYVGAIDLLVGGTPCQDLSVAGKRAGFEGARSSLALDFVRLAYETRCQYLVWENVPGVFSSNRGRDFTTLLSYFAGYNIEAPRGGWKTSGIVKNVRPDRYGLAWRVLDAQFTRTPCFPFAVPQRRRRVFLVGCLGDWERAASVLLEPDRLSWDTPARIKTRKAVAGSLGGCVEDASAIRMRSGCEGGGKGSLVGRELSHTLATGNDQTIIGFDHLSHWDDPSFPHPTLGAISTGIGASNQEVFAQRGAMLVPTSYCVKDARVSPCDTVDKQGQFMSDVVPCLTATSFKEAPSVNAFGYVRRLLPVECERLMGFPDNHTRIPWNGRSELECPDGPRYKACGNSFCVNVVEWIGRRIDQFNF